MVGALVFRHFEALLLPCEDVLWFVVDHMVKPFGSWLQFVIDLWFDCPVGQVVRIGLQILTHYFVLSFWLDDVFAFGIAGAH